MSASYKAYSSVRRSLQPSAATNESVSEDCILRPRASKGSLDLLLLLQLLSFHKAKHLSITLLEGFHRGIALGEGASFNVKEFPLPTNWALHHLRIRDPSGRGNEDSHFEDIANERWTAGTKGAYKSVSSTTYSELVRELRVLCHPPLQDFIVRLAGLAWITRPIPRGENALEEIPVIVVERAPRGSLHDFMQSADWKSSRVSLKAKLRICVRVLRCIAALHSCGVVHADIKTSNVLVYAIQDFYSENWRIKLSDFGNSIPNIGERPEADRSSIHGTPLYQAPELDRRGSEPVPIEKPTAIDIWSWGMLFWEVINDGEAYKDRNDAQILVDQMQRLRESAEVGSMAYDVCLSKIKKRHVDEHGDIRRVVLEALQGALRADPLTRPSALDLLSQLRESLPDENVREAFSHATIPPIASLPPFDVTHQYYDLFAFSSVPTQVFKALEDCSNANGTSRSHAKFQLGLCHVSGFGTKTDIYKGLAMIHEAAIDGSRHARTIIARYHRAFGIPIPYESRETFFLWLSESADFGSRIAAQDLKLLFPERLSRQRELPKLPDGRWSQKLSAICDVVRKGGEAHFSPQDLSIGPNGDSILHWCVFLPPTLGGRIATLLMNHGCSPATVTRVECSIGNDLDTDSHCTVMPSRTTPIDWAIIEDNVEVLKVLLRGNQSAYGDTIESPALTPATCAAHLQRFECLKYILDLGHDASNHDENGFTPMFHATRPDIFTRILRFSEPSNAKSTPQTGDLQQLETPAWPPVLQMEIDILKLLQEHGASLKACQQDDFNCLHLAMAAEDSPVLEHLFKMEDVRGYINQNDKGGWSPLGYAISFGNERAINMLLANGADINRVSSLHGYNALHICAIYPRLNSAKIASKLIDRSHKVVNSRSQSGYTALHFAAVAGSVPLMNTLSARGAHLMAASNFVTPLGLAIAYWSELGVEEMCSIHRKNKVPLVAAFDDWRTPTPLPVSQAVGPLTMVLAPGRHSTMKRVRELRGHSDQAGCYDPPMSGLAENILRTILRYPASGSLLEYLKIYYYQITEQYSFAGTPKRDWRDMLSHMCILLGMFTMGSLWFVVYGVDETHDAIRRAIRTSDSRAVEILLEECSHRKVSANIRRLVLHSQDRIFRLSGQEKLVPFTRTLDIARAEYHVKITNLLMEQQNQIFSQVKDRRINGGMRILWRPLYRLYLDLEQTEYRRFNDWVLHKRPTMNPVVTEFRSLLPSPRISTYPLFFAALWAILGQMLYHLSRFVRNADEPFNTSKYVWTVVLVIILHLCLIWPIIFRVASVNFDAYLGKTYGVLHTIFQMIVVAVIAGYSFVAAFYLSPEKNPILPCIFTGQQPYNIFSESSDPMAMSSDERLIWSWQEPLNKSCQKCEMLQAWLCLISLVPSLAFFGFGLTLKMVVSLHLRSNL